MDLAGVDITRIISEWQSLRGGRINRVTQRERMLILDVYAEKQRHYLLFDPPDVLICSTIKPEGTPVRGVAKRARKDMEKGIITEIGTRFADRVFWLVVRRGEKEYKLILEYFGKGNVILTEKKGEDWVITAAREYAEYGVRSIRQGKAYQPPPGEVFSYEDPDAWLEGEKKLVTLLARHGLGGKYADHVLRVFNLSPDVMWKDLSEAEKERVRDALKGYAQPSGWMLKDATPWLANPLLGEKAVYAAYCTIPLTPPVEKGESMEKEEKEKKMSALERQEAYARELEAELKRVERQASWYYEQYALAKEIEAFITKYWEEKHTLEGIEQDWPRHFPPLSRVEGKRVWLRIEEENA